MLMMNIGSKMVFLVLITTSAVWAKELLKMAKRCTLELDLP